MLKQIEAKLGKSVMDVLHEEMKIEKERPYEIEYISAFSKLSKEELEYLLEHAEMFEDKKK